MADYSKGKVVIISNKDVLEGTIKEILEDIGYEIVKED
jgi:predicted RNA binding protein YcfA (HicA-like mRNA interferase family)